MNSTQIQDWDQIMLLGMAYSLFRKDFEMTRIVLSYAPSAAAVWQCDRVRAMCESNSVRHKVLFKALGLAPLGVLWQPHHNIIISECHNIIIA